MIRVGDRVRFVEDDQRLGRDRLYGHAGAGGVVIGIDLKTAEARTLDYPHDDPESWMPRIYLTVFTKDGSYWARLEHIIRDTRPRCDHPTCTIYHGASRTKYDVCGKCDRAYLEGRGFA